MRVTKIRQAKRRVAIRLLCILAGAFLIGAVAGSIACGVILIGLT